MTDFAGNNDASRLSSIADLTWLEPEDGDRVDQALELNKRGLERTADANILAHLHSSRALALFRCKQFNGMSQERSRIKTPQLYDYDLWLVMQCLVHPKRGDIVPGQRILLNHSAFHDVDAPLAHAPELYFVGHSLWRDANAVNAQQLHEPVDGNAIGISDKVSRWESRQQSPEPVCAERMTIQNHRSVYGTGTGRFRMGP